MSPDQGQDPLEYFEFESIKEGYEYIDDVLKQAMFDLALEDEELMNASIEALDTLTQQLKALIKAPPTPQPSPTVTPMTTPENYADEHTGNYADYNTLDQDGRGTY